MQNKYTFKEFIVRNSYLLITAAWLVTISFIIDNYLANNATQKSVAKTISSYIAKQEKDFDATTADTALLKRLVRSTCTEQELQQVTNKNYFLFIYRKNDADLYDMLFWSSQVVDPLGTVSVMNGKSGFIQLSNGYYVWRKIEQYGLTAVGLIPVKWNYSITNDYLKNSFVVGDKIENLYSIDESNAGTVIKSKEGEALFSLQPKPVNNIVHNNMIASVFRLMAAFFVLIFIQFVATYLVQKRFIAGVSFLVLVIIALRVLSYYTPVPVNFRQYELFDPKIYGASTVLKTLGDLLINALLFLWIVLFVRHYIQEKKVVIPAKTAFVRWAYVLAGLLFLIICTFLCAHIFRTMVADSDISFDVINFYTLNGYSVIGFIVLGSIATGYFFITQIIIYLLQPLLPKNIMVLILLVTIAGLAVLTFRINSPNAIFELYQLIWLLVYLLLLNNKHLFLLASEIISSRLIFWLFFFSLSIDAIVLTENNKRELEKRKKYAENLATRADPSSELLMNTVLTDFRSEALAPLFDRFKTEYDNKKIKDSLLNKILRDI